MKVISIINQKGGVGKTTTSVNLSYRLVELGYKILLIDLDLQGNATSNSNINKRELKKTFKNLLLDDIEIEKCIIKTEKKYDIIGSNINAADTEMLLYARYNRENLLKEKLENSNYDFVILDCPPSLANVTLNALTTTDLALIPLPCEEFAIDGIELLLSIVAMVQNSNKKIDYKYFITQFDARAKTSKDYEKKIKEILGNKVLESKIRVDQALKDSQKEQKTVFEFRPGARSVEDYKKLTEEVLKCLIH